MSSSLVRSRVRAAAILAAAASFLALAPRPAAALSLLHDEPSLADEQLFLLDGPLSLDDRPVPVLTVALADDAKSKDAKAGGSKSGDAKAGEAKPGASSLDFDLLGAPPPTVQIDDRAMHKRRSMLKWHQGVGIGLYAAEVATTVVGQLNYSDKFSSSAANTNQYKQSHQIIAYTTFALFAVNGTLALLTPEPKGQPPKKKWDRVSWHKLGMALATAGMLAQAGTGIYTASREGYLNQQDAAKVHLALGYFTFAAMSAAVGVLVF